MKQLYEFTVPGEPVPKGRPRFGGGKVFTPERTEKAEKAIWVYACQKKVRKMKRPVSIDLVFYWADAAHEADIDNLTKTVLDALNGQAWDDDKDVCQVSAYKHPHPVKEPRTEVRLGLLI